MDQGPLKAFAGPKSICKCGHLGDGNFSDHEDALIDRGHGKCKVCDCKMFEWRRFTPAFTEVLNKAINNQDTQEKS